MKRKIIIAAAILSMGTYFWIGESFSSADPSATPSLVPSSSLSSSCPIHQQPLILSKFGKGDSLHRFRDKADDLRASGSSQFSEQQLPQLLSELKKYHINKENLIIVDLREEPHGFADGLPFHWNMKGVTCLRGKPLSEILPYESAALEALTQQPTPPFFEIEKKEKGVIKKLKEIPLSPQKIMSEADLLASYNIHYERLPVTDHHRPTDAIIDEFIAFIQGLSPDKWIHFHCHAGRGRTSTFLILYDIIKNPNLPLETIIDRQVAQGSLDVRIAKDRKKDSATARWSFIQKFYKYVNDTQYGLNAPAATAKSWSQWAKNPEGATP